jgi:hypothetical protein
MGGRVCLWNMRGVALILSTKSGVFYWNQTCGHVCLQSEAQGVLVPLNTDPPLDEPELEVEHQLAAATRNQHHLSEVVADRVDAILASSSYTSCVRVDRLRLYDSHEAWVYVEVIPGVPGDSPLVGFEEAREGVLTWQNSD